MRQKRRVSEQQSLSKGKRAPKKLSNQTTEKPPEVKEAPSERPVEGQCDAYTFSGIFPLLDEASLADGFEDGVMEREVSAEHGVPLTVISRRGRMTQDTDEVLIEENPDKPKINPKRQRRRWYEQD